MGIVGRPPFPLKPIEEEYSAENGIWRIKSELTRVNDVIELLNKELSIEN